MTAATINKIIELAKANNGYIHTKEVLTNKISAKYLAHMVAIGRFDKIKNGLYRLNDIQISEYESFIEASLAIPKGVISLVSALDFYQLSTLNPIAVHVAIDHKAKITVPEHLNIELHYMSQPCFSLGIEQVSIRNIPVKIYNREKTICDCIKYRNKLGIDLVAEALKNYLNNNIRDLNKLLNYARQCKVEKIIKNYLEILL
jgi:predicted transcriptional regulator of viral defense system